MKSSLRPYWSAAALTLAGSAGCAVDVEDGALMDEVQFDEGDIRTDESAIVNGSTDFTGKVWMRDRTASVRWGNWTNPCSGTLLDPQTVITARHCISTDGKPDGSVRPVTDGLFLARWGLANELPAESIAVLDKDHDVALVFLSDSNRIMASTGEVLFTPIEPIAPAAYEDRGIYISGWGSSKNNGSGTAALRWGRMIVHDYYVGSFKGLDDGIKLRQTSADQRGAPGDSGGPYWGDFTEPPGIIGIHQGDTAGLDPREIGTQAHAVRDWALRKISEHHGLDSGAGYSNTFNSSNALSGTIVKTLGSDPANWKLLDNSLTQANNASPSVLIWPSLVSRDLRVWVDIRSPDDDGAGIVFHYVDKDNFAYCIANEGGNYLKIRERFNGVERDIASATWSGTWSSYRRMHLSAGRGSTYTCSFDGVTISGSQYRLPVGATGLIQDYNNDVRFDSFYYDGSRF